MLLLGVRCVSTMSCECVWVCVGVCVFVCVVLVCVLLCVCVGVCLFALQGTLSTEFAAQIGLALPFKSLLAAFPNPTSV